MVGVIRALTPRSRRTRDDAGQSVAEFAIVLPVLLALVVGIFEFGRSWNAQQVITNAAREGARRAVIPSISQDSVRNTIANYLASANLDPALGAVTIDDGSGVGTPATVTLSYPYEFRFLGPIVDLLEGGETDHMSGAITLSTTVVMRNE